MSRDPKQQRASDEDDSDEDELLNESIDTEDSIESNQQAKPRDSNATLNKVESTHDASTPNTEKNEKGKITSKQLGADDKAVDVDKTLGAGPNAGGTYRETQQVKSRSPSNTSKRIRADKTDFGKTFVEQVVDSEAKKPGEQNADNEKTVANSQTLGELDDLSFLTEMSMAPDESPVKNPENEVDDLSHLTEMTFAAGATRVNQTDSDDMSHLAEMSFDATEQTSGEPAISKGSANKTAKETKTARHDATIGGLPNVEAGDDDDIQIRPSSKGSDLPTHIGRYEIKTLLGEGTFGKVYEARDPQLDRIVAVKVAKAISGRTQIRRFLREARAAARLRHPNIIPVYEYGQVEGENIIVYEYVAGETLKSYIHRNEIPPLDETIRIIREIADGLNYAHEQGIIHRDIKPENILVDPNGRPHIADFGCARSIEDKTNLTVDGSILGTPMYMSPEQAGGKANVADGRTDIWSLGVMVYEMVTGERPFRGQLSELLFSICNKDATSIRKIKPDTPSDLETICTKCLTRELDDRFETAGLLSEELGRFQRGEPIESRRINTLKRTWMWAKRNQAIAGLMATVALTMLVGTIVASAFAIKAHRAQKNRALAQLDAIATAEASALGGIFNDLRPFKTSVLPMLQERLSSGKNAETEKHRLKMAIIELEDDQAARVKLAESMVDDLLESDAGDFFVCRMCLRFRKDELADSLWLATSDLSKESSSGKRFRAAAALALYDPDSPNWQKVAPDVASYLASINEIEMAQWLKSVTPIRDKLKPTLINAFLSRESQSDMMPKRAAAVLSRLFSDNVPLLVGLVPDATPQQISNLSGALGINRSDAVEQLNAKLESLTEPVTDSSDSETPLAIKKSNLATTLIQLGEDDLWLQLAGGRDMSVASELTERLAPASTPYQRLEFQIRQWDSLDADVLAGILLSLGQFESYQILDAQKESLLDVLSEVFTKHPNSRVHSSTRWLMLQWGFQDVVAATEIKLRRQEPDPSLNWHVDLAGNTFALFGPVDSAKIGIGDETRKYWSNEARVARTGFDANEVLNEPDHQKQIPRRFGICIHEVTVGQFLHFQESVFANYEQRIAKLDNKIEGLNKTIAKKGNAQTESNSASADLKPKKNGGNLPQDEANLPDSQVVRLGQLVKEKKRLEIRKKVPARELKRLARLDSQLPISEIDFYVALGFCRWTSEEMKIECGLPSVQELQDFYEKRSDFSLNQEHLAKLGYRLPTASEWEYACRGKTDTLFPFGQTPSVAPEYAWYVANSDSQLQKIGQLKPGNTGLFDIGGNVSEWCLDWYHESLPQKANREDSNLFVDFGPQFQEKAQRPEREYRGSSFKDRSFDSRTSKRKSSIPYSGYAEVGFRLARTYQSHEPRSSSPESNSTKKVQMQNHDP